MSAVLDPPRLVDDPELRALIRAETGREVDPQLLLRAGRAIRAATHPVPRGSWALRSFSRVALVGAGLGILFGVSVAAAYALHGWVVRSRARVAVPPPPATSRAPQASPVAAPPPPMEPLAPEAPPPSPAAERPARAHVGARPTPEPPAEEPRGASLLSAQLAAYGAAQEAARRRDYPQALRLLAELDARYPDHPLRAEVALSRAEWLFLAGRDDEAAAALKHNLEAPGLRGKRAELWRMLGDVHFRQGRRDEACDAYRQALGLGLAGPQAEAARRAVRSCSW